MADTIEQRLRALEATGDNRPEHPGRSDVLAGERERVADDRRAEAAAPAGTDRDAEVPVETEEERVRRERSEWLAEVDATEISDTLVTTTAYRRAVAVFDDGETTPQLAEFFDYVDTDFERHGRF